MSKIKTSHHDLSLLFLGSEKLLKSCPIQELIPPEAV